MRAVTVFLALVATVTTLSAQGPTLRQLAIEHEGKVGRSAQGCGWAGEPFPNMVKRTGVAVLGTVLSKRSYATPDDRDIYTDFEMAPEQILMQRAVIISARSGPPAPMVFKTLGGTVSFDGYAFTFDVASNGRRVTLNVGDRVVLFGAYDARDGKWLFHATDVFSVTGDTVINELPAIEPYAETFPARMPISLFAQRIRELDMRLR